mmetsp:Transcript_765/g.1273  ORF Transcript_765/g.1273 Transcript_765/m.1273 type:complete len:251 (+) Transcript_765:54-806(+)
MAASGRTLVFGGRGLVGAAICRELSRRGVLPVASVGRSEGVGGGGPVCASVEQVHGVDALNAEACQNLFVGDVRAVVISMGLPPWIIDREKAVRANGLTNVSVLKMASEHKVKRIILLNATMPTWSLISSYREGKEMAEAEALKYAESCGPDCGVLILKPSLVSGTRYVGSVPLPLWLAFSPLRLFFRVFATPCQALEKTFPSLLGGCLRPAAHVEEIAAAAVDAIVDPNIRGVKVLSPEDLVGYKSKVE